MILLSVCTIHAARSCFDYGTNICRILHVLYLQDRIQRIHTSCSYTWYTRLTMQIHNDPIVCHTKTTTHGFKRGVVSLDYEYFLEIWIEREHNLCPVYCTYITLITMVRVYRICVNYTSWEKTKTKVNRIRNIKKKKVQEHVTRLKIWLQILLTRLTVCSYDYIIKVNW